jgi:hypothetical protein
LDVLVLVLEQEIWFTGGACACWQRSMRWTTANGAVLVLFVDGAACPGYAIYLSMLST